MSRYVHNRDHANDIFERGNHMKSQSLRVLDLSGFATWWFSCFCCPSPCGSGGGRGLTTRRQTQGIESNWTMLKSKRWKLGTPSVIQGFIAVVLIPHKYIERVLKVNSPCYGMDTDCFLQDALLSWCYFIAALAKPLRWRHAQTWQQLLVVQRGLFYFRRRATARLRHGEIYSSGER